MFCPNCGKQIEGNTKFCENYGSVIEEGAPQISQKTLLKQKNTLGEAIKKKLNKKIIAVLVLCVCALSGCGKTDISNIPESIPTNTSETNKLNDNIVDNEVNSETDNNTDVDTDIIEISSANELMKITYNPSGNYILTTDIDLSQNKNWKPLCSSGTPFTGTLDGNGYCIKNMNVDLEYKYGGSPFENNDSEYSGLFSCIEGALIKNIGIVGGNVRISSSTNGGAAGAFAGKSSWRRDGDNIIVTEFINCYVDTTVESHVIENGTTSYHATMRIGGFVGEGCANFTNCYTIGKLKAASAYADQIYGGFIGSPDTASYCPMTIKYCYTLGLVSVRSTAGGWRGGLLGDGSCSEVDIQSSYYGTDADKYGYQKVERAATNKKDEEFTSVKGLTIETMKIKNHFEGFDFDDAWAISPDLNGGYPYLKSQKSVSKSEKL